MANASHRDFGDLIDRQWSAGKHLCIGLDTDVSKVPPSLRPADDLAVRMLAFNEKIVDATGDVACAYKPNSAYYEALGSAGVFVLEKTIEYINDHAPGVPVIVDGKRGDIDNTNEAYASFLFDQMGADAATVQPYFGRESLAPILARRDKAIFVLARTSNPGAGEFQDLVVDGVPLYMRVAQAVAQTWNYNGNCGLVIGATYPDELRRVRDHVPHELPILMPGIGIQGGNLADAVHAVAGLQKAFIINASRSIIFASPGSDFDEAARREAMSLSSAIESVLAAPWES